MAFVRIQGNKILILHSKRIEERIKQEKLHVFESFSDAHDIVESDHKWDLLCATLSMQYGIHIDNDKLRDSIKKKLEAVKFEDTHPFHESLKKVLGFLLNCKVPLSPKQKSVLEKSKDNLVQLADIIDKKLLLMERPMNTLVKYEENEAEKCLDRGLDCYECGEWDNAKEYFLQGLKSDPNHVDLLVHAGLIEYIHENYSLALNYFNEAAEIGKQLADLMIAADPDEYVKNIDMDKWAEGKFCEWSDECPDWNSDKCIECDRDPKNMKTELYRYLEFRPFFRSLTNKASTLMKLTQYEEAIETLKLCQEYQPLWGTYNMIGVCYLSRGDVQKADDWYGELLWNDAFYIKSLIKYKLGDLKEAFNYLLIGIIKNPYIANILLGIEKPEGIRYVGDHLPDRLKASEFFYNEGYLFKNTPDFRILIRCILEHEEIAELLEKLEHEKDQQETDHQYKMPAFYWDLLHGKITDEFLSQYLSGLIDRMNNKSGDYWKPRENDILKIEIIEKKQQNWLVRLNDFEKELYFRPKSHIQRVDNGDLVQICVSKSWYYRKRLFIAGDVVTFS